MSHVDDGELTAYADGAYAPSDPEAQRIAAHLAECVNCRNRLMQAQALSARAAEVLAIAAPVAVHTPPFEQIAHASRPRRRLPAIPLAWAATVVLALGIGWFGRGSVVVPVATTRAAVDTAEASVAAPVGIAAETQQEQTVMRSREMAAPAVAQLSTEVAAPTVVPPPAAAAPPPQARAEVDRVNAGAGVAAEIAATGAAANAAPQRLPMIADLEVVNVSSVGDSVVVQQKLPDGVVVTLTSRIQGMMGFVERRETAKRSAESFADAAKQNTVLFNIYGPLTEDSLRALRNRIRWSITTGN